MAEDTDSAEDNDDKNRNSSENNTPEEEMYPDATGRVEGVYYMGDTASMSQTHSSGAVGYFDIVMTDWGTYVGFNTTYVYATFEVVNTGEEDINISAYSFQAYVNNYSYDVVLLSQNGLSATLSPGHRTSGNVFIEMNPGDVNNLELELGDIIFRIQDNSYQNSGDFWGEDELSDFILNNLYLYGGNYEGNNQTSINVSIYSSFGEGNKVGNVFLYDSLGHETLVSIKEENGGEGVYTLYLDGSGIMYIRFYRDSYGGYYADIQGLDSIYTNVDKVETYIMTEQYIP